MATWAEVVSVLNQQFRVRMTSELLVVDISTLFAHGKSADWNDLSSGSEQVYVHRSEIRNDASGALFEFMEINAALGPVGTLDVLRTVAHAGQFIGAQLAYAPGSQGGVLSLATSIPLATLDVRNPLGIWQPVSWIAVSANAALADMRDPAGNSVARHRQIKDAIWYVFRQSFKASPKIILDYEFPDGGAFFRLTSATGVEHRFVMARDQSAIDDRVQVQLVLGNSAEIDLARAAEACALLPGGIVCADGLVNLRCSLSLSELTMNSFNIGIAKLVIAAENYQSVRS